MRILKNVFATTACACLVLAQPAAAATRSAASLPASGMQLKQVSRVGSATAKAEELEGLSPLMIILFLSFLVIGGVLIADDGNDSPG